MAWGGAVLWPTPCCLLPLCGHPWCSWGPRVWGTIPGDLAVQPCWHAITVNTSQAASVSAFKTTRMSSLVVLWSKYFGHLDAIFCACEIKCVINLFWPGDRVGREGTSPRSKGRAHTVLSEEVDAGVRGHH